MEDDGFTVVQKPSGKNKNKKKKKETEEEK